jgi:hypothetical protein
MGTTIIQRNITKKSTQLFFAFFGPTRGVLESSAMAPIDEAKIPSELPPPGDIILDLQVNLRAEAEAHACPDAAQHGDSAIA